MDVHVTKVVDAQIPGDKVLSGVDERIEGVTAQASSNSSSNSGSGIGSKETVETSSSSVEMKHANIKDDKDNDNSDYQIDPDSVVAQGIYPRDGTLVVKKHVLQQLGFTIIRKLGFGHCGTVYECFYRKNTNNDVNTTATAASAKRTIANGNCSEKPIALKIGTDMQRETRNFLRIQRYGVAPTLFFYTTLAADIVGRDRDGANEIDKSFQIDKKNIENSDKSSQINSQNTVGGSSRSSSSNSNSSSILTETSVSQSNSNSSSSILTETTVSQKKSRLQPARQRLRPHRQKEREQAQKQQEQAQKEKRNQVDLIAMELMQCTVKDLLQSGAFCADSVRLLHELAVKCIKNNILHGDLHTENVMLARSGAEMRLIDLTFIVILRPAQKQFNADHWKQFLTKIKQDEMANGVSVQLALQTAIQLLENAR